MAGRAFDLRARSPGDGHSAQVDQRAALFGQSFGRAAGDAVADARHLEEQNDAHILSLESRVSALREVSHGLSAAVSESSKILAAMGDSMDTAGRLVRGTVVTLKTLVAGSAAGGHMCRLVGFIFAVFFLLWLLVR